jgi:hypothetical protein
MTVVATALRVDDIAAETDEGGIQVSKVERHRRELESVQHAPIEILAIVEILGVAVSDERQPAATEAPRPSCCKNVAMSKY